MKKLNIMAVGLLSAALAIAVFAAPASAKPGIKSLAKAECKQERATDTKEFVAHFGGTGKAALKRCIRHEKREATRRLQAGPQVRDERVHRRVRRDRPEGAEALHP